MEQELYEEDMELDMYEENKEQELHEEERTEESGNTKVPRISLNERIQKDNQNKPVFLKVFELFADEYFIGLCKISMDICFANRYESFIEEMLGGKACLLSVCIYHVESLPEEDRDLFLYYTLIEPFVRIPVISG